MHVKRLKPIFILLLGVLFPFCFKSVIRVEAELHDKAFIAFSMHFEDLTMRVSAFMLVP